MKTNFPDEKVILRVYVRKFSELILAKDVLYCKIINGKHHDCKGRDTLGGVLQTLIR
jgi:hypothetical protein